MGIMVADLHVERIGITLPNAYIAVSKSRVALTPLATNVYRLDTNYSIWTSHEARLAGKAPLDTTSINLVWDTSADDTLAHGYTFVYDHIKQRFPNHVDDVAQPVPAQPPSTPPPETT